jgi:hypothetical protein
MRHTEYRHLLDVGGLISRVPRVRNTISHRTHAHIHTHDAQTREIIVTIYLHIHIHTTEGTIENSDDIIQESRCFCA